MKLYRFSPIENKEQLLEAIKYVHGACYKLVKQSLGEYSSNYGNVGIFCHYEDEYELLTRIRQELTRPSDNLNQKYFQLQVPITVAAQGDVPETKYTHLYIRKPDPYRLHVGDVDFYLEPERYAELKESLLRGKSIKGTRIFERSDLDMIELYDPDIDALAYVSTNKEAEKVRVKQSETTKL